MLGKTYALAGRIVKPKTIPAVGVGVEKLPKTLSAQSPLTHPW